MKKVLLSTVALIGLISLIFSTQTSCKKETVTETITDTVIQCTPKSPELLLTAKTWKAEEIRSQLSNGISQYYIRGGGSNNVNYDSDSIKFNTNNTGIYYYSGNQYTTTWNFINSQKSKILLIVNYPTPLTINMENVTLDDNYFCYCQYVTTGLSYLASGRRVPN